MPAASDVPFASRVETYLAAFLRPAAVRAALRDVAELLEDGHASLVGTLAATRSVRARLVRATPEAEVVVLVVDCGLSPRVVAQLLDLDRAVVDRVVAEVGTAAAAESSPMRALARKPPPRDVPRQELPPREEPPQEQPPLPERLPDPEPVVVEAEPVQAGQGAVSQILEMLTQPDLEPLPAPRDDDTGPISVEPSAEPGPEPAPEPAPETEAAAEDAGPQQLSWDAILGSSVGPRAPVRRRRSRERGQGPGLVAALVIGLLATGVIGLRGAAQPAQATNGRVLRLLHAHVEADPAVLVARIDQSQARVGDTLAIDWEAGGQVLHTDVVALPHPSDVITSAPGPLGVADGVRLRVADRTLLRLPVNQVNP